MGLESVWLRARQPVASPQPPDPSVLVMRQLIGECMGHAQQSDRLKLMPSRDAKLNGVIDRQAVVLRMLAMLADEVLAARGEVRSIEWKAVPKNGAGVVEPG